jgi:hypothetical protein
MDLGLYLRVLWRFRVVVAAGIALSGGLAFLTQARIDLDGVLPKVSYRTPQVWASTSTVLITEKGFPWGAASLADDEALARGEKPRGPQYTDPGRFTQLALLYAGLAKSDDVRAIVDQEVGRKGTPYSVWPAVQDGVTLPIISIRAPSTSPQGARKLARIVTQAFRSYIAREQDANAIPPERRVRLEVVRSASGARVISSRSIVKPMFVFILGLAATFVLVFALENLRPREPEVGMHDPASPFPVVSSERKTA